MSQSLSLYLGAQRGVADSAENILTKLKTVDGAGSGLDADTVDGQTLGTMAFKNTDDVGSITANTVTATSFVGDGSQLTGAGISTGKSIAMAIVFG